jgi:hypothetical protein
MKFIFIFFFFDWQKIQPNFICLSLLHQNEYKKISDINFPFHLHLAFALDVYSHIHTHNTHASLSSQQ